MAMSSGVPGRPSGMQNRKRRSGSGDGLLPHLDKVIRFEWNRAHPNRRAELKRPREEPRPRNSLDEYTTRSRVPRITEADWLGDY